MSQLLKRILLLVALLAIGFQSVRAYVTGGPINNAGDNWQAQSIGYALPGDIMAPKNVGEEYRRNRTVLFYSYNQNFFDFFGLEGAQAVDGAFAVMNSLTNVSSYSSDLSEFPLNSQHFNFTAQALGLTDLKSITLNLLAEQMGLGEPERFTWTLHDRFLPNGGQCPLDEEYLVVQRNFDILNSPLNQVQYSPYVNGTLYSYTIFEFCTGTAFLSGTAPFPVDPFADTFTALASFGLETGGFYTGPTRDDVAGLRYMLRTNNINRETVAAGSVLLTTNLGASQLLTSSNLNTLLLSAQTNDPALLPGLFPGLVVSGSSNYFTVVCTPIVTSGIANNTGAPFPAPAPVFLITNGFDCVPQTIFVDTFANVITNGNLTNTPNIVLVNTNITLNYSSNTTATVVTTSLGQKIGAPFGTLATNTTTQTVILTNAASGEYLIIPPGQCGWRIISILTTNTVFTTNITTTATNVAGFVDSQSIVTAFTSHTFVVQPIFCPETVPAAGLYQGIENVKFVRADFDSLIGQFFQPVTNTYSMVLVTNSQPVTQILRRVVTAPDFLLTAEDLADGPGNNTIGAGGVTRNINFNQANILPGLAGPGVINTPTTFTYDKVGNNFLNGPLALLLLGTNAFLSELTQFPLFTWASFDASTNAPVIYPNGTSIDNIENQILVQISPPPPTLPVGTSGVPYAPVTFTATGGAFSPPFTWSLASGSAGLPSGLTLSAGGTISGTPTQIGTFDFIIQLNDSLSRTVRWNYTIIIQ